MTKQKQVKKEDPKIDLDYFKTAVCKDKSLEPFLNSFNLKGTNVDQERLGQVFGVIQILDHAEESSYLPNLLAQVIKKEFYSKPKRALDKSFEAALHKANLALADLAQHEIIGWMGNMNAVMGVIKDKEFIFTQAGGGRILMIREGQITDISRGLDEDDSHPMKTFSNISSGQLEKDDKIMFVSEALFDTFSWEDLKRHAKIFKSDEFDNLIKSTLESEGENVGTLIVNLKEIPAVPVKKRKKATVNFFGGEEAVKETAPIIASKAITKTKKKKQEEKRDEFTKDHPETKKEILEKATLKSAKSKPSKKETPSKSKSIPDKEKNKDLSPFEKQPELYIKDGDPTKEENEQKKDKFSFGFASKALSPLAGFHKTAKEKTVQATKSATKSTKKIMQGMFAKSKVATAGITAGITALSRKNKVGNKSSDEKSSSETEKVELSRLEQEKPKQFKEQISYSSQFEERPAKVENIKEPPKTENENVSKDKKELVDKSTTDFFENISKDQRKKEEEKIGKKFSSFWIKDKKDDKSEKKPSEKSPLFKSLMKFNWNKNALIGLVAFIGVIALFLIANGLLKNGKDGQAPINTNEPVKEAGPVPEEPQSNLQNVANLQSESLSMTAEENELFFYTKSNEFFSLNTKNNELKKIDLPNSINNVSKIVTMEDLRLVFLLMPNNVVSYSPVTENFQENKIDLPANLEIAGAGTYLTFLYLLDRNSGQIYRYPRAEGGFGESVTWLDDSIDASDTLDMAIDENIRLSFGAGRVEKYFRGKLEDTKEFGDDLKIIARRIKTGNDSNSYYLMDAEQGKILKVKKDGDGVEKEYEDVKIKKTVDFSIDEKNNQAFITTKDGEVLKIDL